MVFIAQYIAIDTQHSDIALAISNQGGTQSENGHYIGGALGQVENSSTVNNKFYKEFAQKKIGSFYGL